ncbi:ComEA family DNA-binding protein [Thalassotalea agarivorans]|uniref:Competence protein ComEA n=1 Tax=Thalassotalea agarivorans TaxID=349064 RepID=A0A1I0HCG9_THASX|nr:ComEA family DNA-binding protein [Thalassotalea agarivorans]SET81399.1 competence protein ComEA [Thalassotalea agarivorans]
MKLSTLVAIALIVCTTIPHNSHAFTAIAKDQQSVKQTININKASAAQFAQLKGVGVKKAEAIVQYRSQIGGFKTLAQLTEVKGIGEKVLADNKALLSL